MNNCLSKENRRWYKALGFIESLIAIILVGVVSVILMRIAASTMMDTVQNERIDKMTQYAVEGAVMTENIIQEMLTEGIDPKKELNLIYGSSHAPRWFCFVPYSESNKFNFKKMSDGVTYKVWSNLPIQLDHSLRNELGMEANAGLKEEVDGITRIDYFRVACIERIYTGTNVHELSIKIIVGHILSEGNKTKGGNVKDYTYDFTTPL